MFCSHDNKSDKKYTCLTLSDLIDVIEIFNKEHLNDPIDYKRVLQKSISDDNKTERLWNLLNKRHFSTCGNDEFCWFSCAMNQSDPKIKKIIKDRYRPVGPPGHEWLSNFDIMDVMDQFERKDPSFKFFGPYPRDFQDIVTNSKFNITTLFKQYGVNKFGFVFNQSKHKEPGSHWVSAFIDLSTPDSTIEYFDSGAQHPKHEIDEWFHIMKDKIQTDLGKKVTIKKNKIQHQFKDSECGVYSMNFIVNRLGGQTFEEFTSNIIKDDQTNKLRFKEKKGFFTPPPTCALRTRKGQMIGGQIHPINPFDSIIKVPLKKRIGGKICPCRYLTQGFLPKYE
jgi:hypothetical protein